MVVDYRKLRVVRLATVLVIVVLSVLYYVRPDLTMSIPIHTTTETIMTIEIGEA